jgi:1,4-alpha-glucan branching enzyme
MRPEVGKVLKEDQVNYIRFGDSDSPQNVLGRHFVDQGQVISYYHPYAREAILDFGDECYDMENIEQTNLFSVFVPHQKEMPYHIRLILDDQNVIERKDPYLFKPRITKQQAELWGKGTWTDAYRYMGAHPMTLNGVEGTYFAVWAPNAKRVSVVGDFNHWDGRIHSMIKGRGGIFELFIPDVKEDMLYKYEIKTRLGDVFLKADPFANAFEVAPKNASVITDFDGYQWNDKKWMEERKEKDISRSPVVIYGVHLGSWITEGQDESSYNSYEDLAKHLVSYMLSMGYTHLQLLGVMEHLREETMGQEVYGFFAPTSRFGKIKEFKYFIDYLHQHGIGVILDWAVSGMTKDPAGMTGFDGTALFESTEESKQQLMQWNTAPFDYSKNQVFNYMISNAYFWMDEFHIDGFCLIAQDCRIYENTDMNYNQCFIARFINAVNQKKTGCFVISEFMSNTCMERKNATFQWIETYADYLIRHLQKESYIKRELDSYKMSRLPKLNNSEKNIIIMQGYFGKSTESIVEQMPGDYFAKFANLRALYAFLIGMCGKKHIFMGQDIGQWSDWSTKSKLDWDALNQIRNEEFQNYEKDLFHFYSDYSVLYESDYFTWISKPGANEIVVFRRNDKERNKELMFICNFTPMDHEAFQIGMKERKQYKQVFSSDKQEYGGLGTLKNTYLETIKQQYNGYPYSLMVQLPRQSVIILEKLKG